MNPLCLISRIFTVLTSIFGDWKEAETRGENKGMLMSLRSPWRRDHFVCVPSLFFLILQWMPVSTDVPMPSAGPLSQHIDVANGHLTVEPLADCLPVTNPTLWHSWSCFHIEKEQQRSCTKLAFKVPSASEQLCGLYKVSQPLLVSAFHLQHRDNYDTCWSLVKIKGDNYLNACGTNRGLCICSPDSCDFKSLSNEARRKVL